MNGIEYYIKKLTLIFPIGIGAYFAPLIPLIFTALGFIVIDTIIGVWAAIKRNEEITAHRLGDIIPKCIIYMLMLTLSHVFDDVVILASDYIVTRGMIFILVVVEFKSIVEKAEEITGKKLWTKVKELLNAQAKIK